VVVYVRCRRCSECAHRWFFGGLRRPDARHCHSAVRRRRKTRTTRRLEKTVSACHAYLYWPCLSPTENYTVSARIPVFHLCGLRENRGTLKICREHHEGTQLKRKPSVSFRSITATVRRRKYL